MEQVKDHKANYNHLKRKLEDLEEVHKEGKRFHATETEHLRDELARIRKIAKEQEDHIARLKRHNELTEARAQDLKKDVAMAQSEAREVRVKLRDAETQRDRLTSKQSSALEMRRAAAAVTESRAKEKIQEREARIEELQKAVVAEKKRSLEAERHCDELKSKLDKDGRDARLKLASLERDYESVKMRLSDAESHNVSLECKSSSTTESLELQASQYKALLETATKEYGRLATSTVSLEKYDNLRTEASRLRICIARLERKVANSDEQVVELANLIRQTQITNSLLSEQLKEACEELEWRTKDANSSSESIVIPVTDDTLEQDIDKCLEEERCSHENNRAELDSLNRTQFEYYRILNSQLIEHLSSLEHLLTSEKEEVSRLKSKLSESDLAITRLSSESDSHKKESEELSKKVSEQNSEIYTLRTRLSESENALAAAEAKVLEEVQKKEELLRKEREITSSMQATVQKGKMAEEALKAEIEQLMIELADVEDYREAYQTIAEEMRGLVARNALAEDEATRLSEFNAEILSHRNPTQKILYVDRIRRELADTKQKLALSQRDNETAQAEAATLRDELAMYKSVGASYENKPRTHLTRIRRVPLGSTSSRKSNVIQTRTRTRSQTQKQKQVQAPVQAPEEEEEEYDFGYEYENEYRHDENNDGYINEYDFGYEGGDGAEDENMGGGDRDDGGYAQSRYPTRSTKGRRKANGVARGKMTLGELY